MRLDIKVTQREYDTILAALRFWQNRDGLQSAESREIAAYNGDPLSYPEIDDLIERMQTS